ncbi:MAG: hypothetical protein U1G05_02865 [Kiritimatiellia bacterium]
MMDTVLNLGLNDRSVQGFIQQTGQERTAWDCYRRFIDMFGDVVMGPASGLTHHDFEVEMEALKRKYGAAQDTDSPPTSSRSSSKSTRRCTSRRSRSPSRRIRSNSSNAPSRPCSTPGTPSAPRSTARSTRSRA